MNRRRQFLFPCGSALWLAIVVSGCSDGVIGFSDAQSSFQELLRAQDTDVQTTSSNEFDLPLPTPGTADASLTAQITADIFTIGRCHAGDLDVAAELLERAASLAPGQSAAGTPQLILSLESRQGVVLASVPLDINALSPRDTLQKRLTTTLNLELPENLVAMGSFYVSAFICVDSNGNGACSDERVDTMQLLANGEATTDVSSLLAYLPLEVEVVDGTEVKIKAVDGFQIPGDAALREVAGVVEGAIKNYGVDEIDPDLAGDAPPAALTLVLAKHSARACTSKGRGAVLPTMWATRNKGCFVAGTRIEVAPGLSLPVEQLPGGSQLLTAAGQTVVSLHGVAGPESQPVITIETAAGHLLTVTSEHPMLTADGLKRARDLTTHDQLQTAEGSLTPVQRLRSEPYNGLVYNFALPGDSLADHLIIAEGLVTGDLHLQQQLAQQ